MSAAPRTYIDLVVDLVENFITHGFKRIVLVNGHGGNNVPGQQALFEVRQKHRQRDDLLLLFACYWAIGGRPYEKDPSIVQRAMGHACEWETSMILAHPAATGWRLPKGRGGRARRAVRPGAAGLDDEGP